MKKDIRASTQISAMGIVLLLLIGVGTVGIGYHQVNEGYVGVHTKLGAVTGEVQQPGATWIIPGYQGVKNVEIRPRTYTMAERRGEGDKEDIDDAVSVPTKDGVDVKVDITIRYRVQADKVPKFVSEWHSVEQAEQRLIRPTVRSTLRDEGGDIPTSDIYTKDGRDRLREAVRKELDKDTRNEAVVVEAVLIREVRLPPGYQKSLEKKEIEKQRVLQADYAVDRAEKEKEKAIVQAESKAEQRRISAQARADARRIQAEAEADAIKVVNDELTEDYVDYEFVRALDRTDTIYFMGSDGNNRPYLTKEVGEEKTKKDKDK